MEYRCMREQRVPGSLSSSHMRAWERGYAVLKICSLSGFCSSGKLRHGTCYFCTRYTGIFKINNAYGNLKEALSYTQVTMETAFVGVAINYHQQNIPIAVHHRFKISGQDLNHQRRDSYPHRLLLSSPAQERFPVASPYDNPPHALLNMSRELR